MPPFSLAYPEWVHPALISLLATSLLAMVGLVGWFIRKWMKDIEDARKEDNKAFTDATKRMSEAVDRLNETLHEQSEALKIFQESMRGELAAIRLAALSADRQSEINKGEIIDLRTDFTKLKTEHDIFKQRCGGED